MKPKGAQQRSVRTYGGETRELILRAAENLFAADGLHNVSMQDIAEAANVARATVFNQFGSKHMVLDAITARSLGVYLEMLKAALADDATPTPDLLRKLFQQMGKGIERNRALHREVFAEIRKVAMGLEGAGESPRLKDEAFATLTAIMQRGQDRGEITSTAAPDVLATAFDSLLSGAVIQWLHEIGRAHV